MIANDEIKLPVFIRDHVPPIPHDSKANALLRKAPVATIASPAIDPDLTL